MNMNIAGLVTTPMSSSVNTFIGVFDLIVAIATILVGVIVISRFKGKLKSAIVFLISAVIVILVREFLYLAGIIYPGFVVGIMRIVTVLLILLAMLSMKSMISDIDGRYKK